DETLTDDVVVAIETEPQRLAVEDLVLDRARLDLSRLVAVERGPAEPLDLRLPQRRQRPAVQRDVAGRRCPRRQNEDQSAQGEKLERAMARGDLDAVHRLDLRSVRRQDRPRRADGRLLGQAAVGRQGLLAGPRDAVHAKRLSVSAASTNPVNATYFQSRST